MKPDDDLPEITDAMLASAELRQGDRTIRRGRPPSRAPKEAVKLRLDPDVLAYFRALGEGWQTRINAALRRVAKLGKKPLIDEKGEFREFTRDGVIKAHAGSPINKGASASAADRWRSPEGKGSPNRRRSWRADEDDAYEKRAKPGSGRKPAAGNRRT
jgi:uncharacterized protein (DUF4415 family)